MADFTGESLAPSGFTPLVGVIDAAPAQAPVLLGATSSPPTIGSFTPASSSSITRTGTVQFDVTDADGFSAIVVVAQLASGLNEVVHDGSAFRGPFAGSSTRTPITGGYRYVISYDSPGWPTSSVLFRIQAVDVYGAGASSTSYTVSISNPPADADAAPPVVANVDPATGTPLQRAQSVAFDVTDAGAGLRRVIVLASFGTGEYEVVHDGTAFAPRYTGLSVRSAITGGYRYSVRRFSGWPSGPTITAIAIDAAGNEN